jgi:glycosyltransferase involved in cell wall biosynthesis
MVINDNILEDLPKITIITPTYNQGNFIEETIKSVIDQNYPNLEYIIIDGGSTDNTIEIIKKYEQHIFYWISEKDSGQSNAINKGLKLATGHIINWLNSDDVMLAGCLHAVAAYFNKNPGTDLVYGNIVYFNKNKELPCPPVIANKLQFYAHICFPQPAAFFSKKVINIVGLIDENIHFSMDWDLYVRANLVGLKFLQVPEIFCKFRIHNNSKTVSSFNKQFLIDNALIFYSVVKSINSSFYFIDKIYDELNIDIPVTYKTYKVSVLLSEDDLHLMVFYFLEYRCKTLFFNKDYKDVIYIVDVSKKYFKKFTRTSTVMKQRYFISKFPGFVIKLMLKFRTSRDDLA